MRTRSQSKQPQSTGEEAIKRFNVSDSIDDNETLSNISRDAVGKLLKRVKKGFNKEDVDYLRQCEFAAKLEIGSKENNEQSLGKTERKDTKDPDSCYGDKTERKDTKDPDSCHGDTIQLASSKERVQEVISQDSKLGKEEYDDSDWEDGSIPTLSSPKDFRENLVGGVSVEFEVSPGLVKKKVARRATAEEKEVAEIVHKAHLLCLLGRGRLIDSACNDPLIQASLLSLLPKHLLKIAEFPKLTASHLSPLVSWFHDNFHVRSSSVAEKTCHLALASTLETREGTPETVAALSVALFRALNLTTRFVSILDVVSLKPDADKSECATDVLSKGEEDIFNSTTLMVAGPSCSSAYTVKSASDVKESSQIAVRGTGISKTDQSRKRGTRSQDSQISNKPEDKMLDTLVFEATNDISVPCNAKSEGLKRKGDLEFQMQLEMALSATAGIIPDVLESPDPSSTLTPPRRKMKKIRIEESQASSIEISTAIGSRKIGAPLYWAELFCSGDNLTGKWVHVDTVNAIIDGEDKVEAAAAACKKSLRYVVAFAGNGAKDVTRRYCTKWYKVASQRINSTWWDSVLAPLKELESGATGGTSNFEQKVLGDEKIEPSLLTNINCGCIQNADCLCGAASEECGEKKVIESCMKNSFDATRSSLEDVELETRALTEPLPTNQLAYKNHHLYAIERWLKKYQIIYPKGPVLGFCSGHAVYPRTCVQILHTRQMWLREGLQVKADEVPAKVLKRSMKHCKEESVEDYEYARANYERTVDLYGKWQTEPLCLPRAVDGIVPKNERGQVEVWSEKCLPPGTIHLRYPRVEAVAKRLGIDFAPAMVGFESRNDRSFPVFEGIVVCKEFKDAILEAYVEEEKRREVEEKRRDEARALSKWYQLLSSTVTRQRLNDCYGDTAASLASIDIPKPDNKCLESKNEESPQCQKQENSRGKCGGLPSLPTENHEHEYILDEQASDTEGLTRVKRCHCGFSIQFEEL